MVAGPPVLPSARRRDPCLPLAALPPILWIGNDWFAENRTSSHHAAAGLSAHTRVLYFGCPGLRRPEVSGRDLRRALAKSLRAASGLVNLSESLAVGTLLQLPFHGAAPITRLNGAAGAWIINRALRRARIERPIVWCAVPHALPYVERLNRSLIVYYCIDQFSAMPGVDPVAVQELDDRLARRADLVIAASRPVFERHRKVNPATRLMPHGVDLRHFARPAHPCARPDEIADVAGPVVGFIGTIEARIDLPLVDWLARQFPLVTFVMIGQIAVPSAALCTAPNVRFLGFRPYADLPRYAQHFDVAIMPYRNSAAVWAANPLKLREYLAMGLPVVSISTPEVEQFRHVVSIAPSRQEFADSVRDALSAGSDERARRARVSAVEGATWDRRVEEMIAAMMEAAAAAAGGNAA
jgi:glycosyltransferase involved in cell wall biosynthesis